jgi:hypothetical protein
VLVLAEMLPGTPLADLLAMRVDEGLAWLYAGAELAGRRQKAMRQVTAEGGCATGFGGTHTVRGGLEELDRFMTRSPKT